MDIVRIGEAATTAQGVGLAADVVMTVCLAALFVGLVVVATLRERWPRGRRPPHRPPLAHA
jgi:hypothetical protein